MEAKKDNTRINDMIKDFFKYNNFNNALECFDAEIRTKKFIKQKPNIAQLG